VVAPQIRQPTTRLLMEFLRERFPRGGYRTNVPLGPVPEMPRGGTETPKVLLSFRPWRPKIDAIAFEDGRLILIEAKDMKWRDGMGNLLVYNALLEDTPELRPFLRRPRELWLLLPWTMEVIESAARRLGVKVVVFTPPWFEKRLEDLHNYWTKEWRVRREERRKLLELMGVE